VATDAKCIRLQIDADARLAAAVGGAARYLADAAGLENEAISQLQSTIVAACREAFDHLSGDHPRLDVTLTRLPDRIEVALSHEGEPSPAVGLDTVAGFAAQIGDATGQPPVLAGIDRVQYETQGGVAVTRFTKYINLGAPSR
jgi:ABC-type transporter Mla subunit MlaD